VNGTVAVFGDLNLDTSVNVHGFPVAVGDTMFSVDGIRDVIGGAAANVACGLHALGLAVRLGAAIGRDPFGALVLDELAAIGLDASFVRRDWPITARTVVLIDPRGDRLCINDPKLANQYRYPEGVVDEAIGASPLVFTSTQSWCRHVAGRARELGRRVAVDVQAIVTDDDYHRDFLRHAQIVIFSTERLSVHSSEFIHRLWAQYDVELAVATHGADGATVGSRAEGLIVHEPRFDVRPVVDKTGAGDAFASGFLAALARGASPREALTWGQLTAAYKIGEKGSTRGVPSLARLEALVAERRR
jgi:acarbose 7IV-phosphotransferase